MGWDEIKYFKPHEFDSPDSPGSGASGMSLEFVRKLDKLREAVKKPLTIKSGFRTQEHNAKVGGVDSSSHESGRAVDVAALSSGTRYAIMEAALRIGFRRVGLGATFVHIDDDPSKPQDVLWTYY